MDGSKNIEPAENATDTRRPSLQIDVERYQEYLDGSDLSEDQRREFL